MDNFRPTSFVNFNDILHSRFLSPSVTRVFYYHNHLHSISGSRGTFFKVTEVCELRRLRDLCRFD